MYAEQPTIEASIRRPIYDSTLRLLFAYTHFMQVPAAPGGAGMGASGAPAMPEVPAGQPGAAMPAVPAGQPGAAAGGMGGAMGEMMKGMGTAPTKEIYPTLMAEAWTPKTASFPGAELLARTVYLVPKPEVSRSKARLRGPSGASIGQVYCPGKLQHRYRPHVSFPTEESARG